MAPDRTSSARGPLDALNFFLADVRDGLGPYLAIYLLTVQHWDEASIGFTLSAAGIAGIVAQTPAGALIDVVRAKRAILVLAALAITAASLAIPLFPGLVPVTILQAISGVAGAVFPPAIAAITLGIVGPKAFAARIGRNEAFNHAGNAVAALLAGALAYWLGPVAVFWLMAAMAVASIAATLSVPAATIDHDVARGLDSASTGSGKARPSGFNVLLANPPLLVFAASTTLFHFANAAMLPLVGQKLALANPELATTLMSACIVAAQLVMVPVALVVGAKADRWGRKRIFAVALAVLCLRGLLYPLSDATPWLIGVQLLDGVGAGIFGALFPLIVADLTAGTGHFNVAQGAIATAQGIGAALSTSVAGAIVVGYGYGAAFITLGIAAGVALVLLLMMMPEPSTRTTAQATAP
ncbi:MAG: MFS transporter [Stutzerimonas stutzeri]|nr:MAG: MFS transporter [Stutzerimonas stutzeri]